MAMRKGLGGKIGLAVGFFCAGTPSTMGTLDLLKNLNVAPSDLDELRYRGKGWPGNFSGHQRSKSPGSFRIPYEESWGFLQKYRPFRCYLCPDGTGEFADIACGDPWYRKVLDGEGGYSLVLVRTEHGRKVLQDAKQAGYVTVERADPSLLEASQRNLLGKRREIWGRLMAMKVFGMNTPKFKGFSLFENWRELTAKDMARSFLGTARRIISRRLYRKQIFAG